LITVDIVVAAQPHVLSVSARVELYEQGVTMTKMGINEVCSFRLFFLSFFFIKIYFNNFEGW
jgi:hypothetical protein